MHQPQNLHRLGLGIIDEHVGEADQRPEAIGTAQQVRAPAAEERSRANQPGRIHDGLAKVACRLWIPLGQPPHCVRGFTPRRGC